MKTYFIIIIIVAYGFIFCNGEKNNSMQNEIRKPAVSGQFYPSDPIKLKNAVNYFLNDARNINVGKPLGIIAPHAGYIYSGQVAADSYNNVKKFKYDLVIILGTNHTSAGFDDISVYPGDGFQTPLGIINVNTELTAKLTKKNDKYKFDNTLHEKEHSIEVQLPFIQTILPDVKILPLVIGSSDQKMCKQLANDLLELTKNIEVLFVASSDLSHYPVFEDAIKVDNKTCNLICEMNTDNFLKTLDNELDGDYRGLSTCACGKAPISVLIHAMKKLGGEKGQTISYLNSGHNLIGKEESVVGYASIIFSQKTQNKTCVDFSVPIPDVTFELTIERKKELLKLARKTIEFYLTAEILPYHRYKDNFYSFKRGAFVTLHKYGQLRGCIGHMAEDMTISKVIQLMAIQSALYDRRFSPITVDEINELEIEISILTPYQKISGIDEITLGTDGVVLRKDNYSSVYLPQVATETGWDKKVFLEQLSLKAGLTRDAYKTAELSTFQALVFSEHELSGK